MASVADDFISHRGIYSNRRSPFQGERTAGSSGGPFRFPKIQPLPNSSDISYDEDDPDVSQREIIQVEEEPEGPAPTVRTAASDSGNDADHLTSDEDDVEEEKAKTSQSQLTSFRSRIRRNSSTRRRNRDSVSSLLVEPGRKLHEPLRTGIVRILCWQLMFSIVVCLPFLLIVDFKPAILTKLCNFSVTISVPFLNIITIPITTLFGVVLFFDLAFVAYLTLAQTDPPDSVTLPFLPWDPWLVWKVNYVLYRWLLVAVRVVPRLMRDWAIRRMLKSKRDVDSTVVYDIHYGSARPRKRLDVYRATLKPSSTDPAQQSSPQRPVPQRSIGLRTSRTSTILPAPGIGGPGGDLVLARNNGEGNTLSPVIVFFHSPQLGPIKGKKWMYESLGRNFVDMGYTVVIPDLTFYPEGKAKQMVQDVRRVLNWTMINIRRYGGDPSQIHVMGHSLGGHLALLTVLQEAIVVSRDKIDDPDIQMANGLRELKIYDGAVRLPRIRGLILLAPICDVNDQIVQEATRGVAHLSKLRRILGPSHTRAMFHSPVHVLHASRNVIDLNLLPPKILFIHGGLDEEVPHFQSELMKEMMHGVGLPFVRCRIYPVGHVDVITALMMKQDEPFSTPILDDLTTFMAL